MDTLALSLAALLALGPAVSPPSEPPPDKLESEPAAATQPVESATPAAPIESPEPAPDGRSESASIEPAPPEPAPPEPAPPEPKPEPIEAFTEIIPPRPAPSSAPKPFGCKDSQSCVRMTAAGIAFGSLGLAGVATGITLLLLPDQVDSAQPIFVTSTRPAGVVTLTLSAGVTLTAVLMMIAARKGHGKPAAGQARIQLDAAGLHF